MQGRYQKVIGLIDKDSLIVKMKNMSQLEIINKEINTELTNESVSKALLATTFKGLTPVIMKQAIMEGMMRGFTFKDFLEKNVYAIPFKGGYSLITSIDYVRKLAMRSGLFGKSEPKFVEDEKGIVSCTITIKRKVGNDIGDYTTTVFFNEYSAKGNLWITKPHTMIAKVAEMQALRSAFPEEMAKNYIEEEMQKEISSETQEEKEAKFEEYANKLEEAKTVEELRDIYNSLSGVAKKALRPLADKLKAKFNSKVKKTKKNEDTKVRIEGEVDGGKTR